MRAAMAAIALALAVLSGCGIVAPWSMEPPPPASALTQAHSDPQQWIGKRLPDLTAKLGEPSSIEPLQETTGDLVIYSHPGFPHYVFETGPDGKVEKAVQVK